MIKNQAGQYLSFQMLSATDGSDVNSGTTNVQLMKDGGSYTGASNAPVFKVYGVWTVALTQAETNCDHLVAAMTISGAITAMVQVYPVNPADFKSDISALATASSISALNDFDPSADTVANVTTVGSVTNAITTDAASRTASQANVSALATASSIAALNDFDPSADTVALVDTTTNLTNGGGGGDATAANQATISAAIAALNDFDASADTVANVTTVGSVTNAVTTDAASRTASQANVSALATASSIAALNDFDPSADTVANVTTVGSVTNAVSATVQSVATDAIDAAAIKADAITEIQNGLATASELANVPKVGTQYTHTAQSGDTIQVTIS